MCYRDQGKTPIEILRQRLYKRKIRMAEMRKRGEIRGARKAKVGDIQERVLST